MRTLGAAARRLKAVPGLPRLWLVTDPARLPDPRAALRHLPPGAAVIARFLAPALLDQVARLARARRLRLLVAGDGRAALRHRAGLHLPDRRPGTGLLPVLLARRGRRGRARPLLTVAAHGRAGLARGRRLRADAVVLSPAFPTASHPGAAGLGPHRWGALAGWAGRPAVALGGVGAGTALRLPRRAAGLAAVSGLAGPAACVALATVFQGSRVTRASGLPAVRSAGS